MNENYNFVTKENKTKHTRKGSAQVRRTNLIVEHKKQIKGGFKTPNKALFTKQAK